MQENNSKEAFSQYAMQYGTLLGLLWCAMYASFIAGLSNVFYSFLFLVLNIASPFFAGYLAINYRKKHCDNCISFSKAWIFLLIMYICASLFSAAIQAVYFRFFDEGYLIQSMQQITDILRNNPDITGEMSLELNKAMETFTNLETKDIIINILSSNIVNSAIITTPIIALFVRRTSK